MVMSKVGLNLSVLQNISFPGVNVSNSSEQIVEDIVSNAGSSTYNYFGLGVMITLFFYLVLKIGRGTSIINEQFSSLRSVGISAGVVSLLGFQMLNLGFFNEFYHVVIFAGITILSWIIIYLGKR